MRRCKLFVQIFIFFLVFSIYFFVFQFPLGFYSSYLLEKKYALLNQSLAAWFRETLKKEIHRLPHYYLIMLPSQLTERT